MKGNICRTLLGIAAAFAVAAPALAQTWPERPVRSSSPSRRAAGRMWWRASRLPA
jgi:hypothetical protein